MQTDVKHISYDDHNFKQLQTDYETLTRFSEVTEWISRANAELERIKTVLSELDEGIIHKTAELEQAKAQRSKLPLIKRMFASQQTQREITQRIAQYRNAKERLDAPVQELTLNIRFLPTTPERKAEILEEMREYQEKLELKKKELAFNMKTIRRAGRDASDKADDGLGHDKWGRKLAASNRRSIRTATADALSPQQNAMSEVELELLALEHLTLRIKGITE